MSRGLRTWEMLHLLTNPPSKPRLPQEVLLSLSRPRTATVHSERRGAAAQTTGKSVSLDSICLQFVSAAGKRSPDGRLGSRAGLPPSRILPALKRVPARRACADPELPARRSRPRPRDVAFSKTTDFLPCFQGKERRPHPGALDAGPFPSPLGQPGVQARPPSRDSNARRPDPTYTPGGGGSLSPRWPILIEIPLKGF